MKRVNRNHTAGYSLIDVVVGIAILGLVTVPVCASLVLSLRLNESSRAVMNAQLKASTAVEMLMAEGIDANEFGITGETTSATMDKYGATVKVEKQDGYFDVTVIGEDGGKAVTLTTSIRVAEGGGT